MYIDFNCGVKLRRPEQFDVHFMRENRNKHEIYKWCRQSTLITEREHSDWFYWQQSEPSVSMFIIENHDKDRVGCCGLTSIDQLNSRAEFSCWITPDQQKRGYCTKALFTLFYHGFNDLNLHTIWGECFDQNPAIDIFLYKLGMLHEGTRRDYYYKNGVYIDAHLVSISKDEFLALRYQDVKDDP